MNEYAGHDEQYHLFINGASYMCDDLGISLKDADINKKESLNGSTYRIHIEGEHTLDFLLDTFVKANKIQKTDVHVDISYNKGSASFYEYTNIAERINEDGYLVRWVTQVIHNFNLKHRPVNLEALFGTTEIRVYGTYRDPILALKEMELLLNGMQYAELNKPIVYKFRHVGDLTRTFSYCFFVSDNHGPNFWAFFHNMSGLDSGGRNISLKIIKEMIATNAAPDLQHVDIEYARLYKFLSRHVTTFNHVGRNTLSFNLNHVWGDFGTTFSESYSKFLESYDNEEYPRALRDLRTLLQTAMEIVCEKNEITIPDKPNIGTLCSSLVESKVLDGKITVWCCAFLSVANLSAHREFSTEDDLLDQNMKDRIKITILLGTQLINELGNKIGWVDDSDDSSYDDLDGGCV